MGLIRIPLPSLLLPQRQVTVRSEFNVKALINVGSGLMDLVSGKACTLTGAFQRTVGPSGWRLYTPSGGVYATSPTGLTSSQPITIVVMSTSTSGASTNALSDSAGGWGVPKIDCLSGVLTATCRVSDGTNLSITGPTVPVGKTYTAALHWRSGIGIKVSFNGGDVQSAANSATALYATPAVLSIGSGSSNTVYFGAAILGTLSDDEIRVLSANPQALLADDDYWLWWPSAAAGGEISASGGAVAGGSATAQAQVALSAIGVAVAGGSAGIQVSVPLSAAGLSVTSGDAGISATVSVSAAGLAQAAGQAGLSADVLMAATGAAIASGNAPLAAQISALAAGAAQAGGSATISGGSAGDISASGGAQATGSAALNVAVQLVSSGGAQAGGTGTIVATVRLTAAGFVQAIGAGALSVSIDLSASGQSTAGGSANLTLHNAALMVVNPRYVVAAPRRSFTPARQRRNFRVRS